MDVRIISTFVILCFWGSADCYKDLNVIANWTILEFGFDSEADQQHAIDNGYVVNNTDPPIDVDVRYTKEGNRKIYVTIPRTFDGIPYSLAVVSKNNGPNGPILHPYPNYDWHKNKSDCTGMTSVCKVAIDDCGHMWVVDTGVDVGKQVCPPQLLTFDLETDQLIHRYQFSEDVYTPVDSTLCTPIVDVRDPPLVGKCQNVMVYVADNAKSGLVVYDSQREAAWRIENKLMDADPNFKNHTIAGQSFMVTDDLVAISVTPRRLKNRTGIRRLFHLDVPYNERYLYFHALASETESKVALRHIDNQTIWQNNKEAMPEAFIELGKRGIQASSEAMDSTGYLYFSIYEPLSVVAWNIQNREYKPSDFKVVADNPKQVQFATGIKVIRNPLDQEELWLFSSKYQNVRSGTLNPKEINFMILACNTDDLFSRRKCRTFGVPSRNVPFMLRDEKELNA